MPTKAPSVSFAPSSLPRHGRMYGRKWGKLRAAHLAGSPFCVECLADGRYVDATDVDHINPHRGDANLFWDSDNLQSLCKLHHGRKTKRGQ